MKNSHLQWEKKFQLEISWKQGRTMGHVYSETAPRAISSEQIPIVITKQQDKYDKIK